MVAGKAACKRALQEELALPVDEEAPLIAFIGRLDPQKGADILLGVRQGCYLTASAHEASLKSLNPMLVDS